MGMEAGVSGLTVDGDGGESGLVKLERGELGDIWLSVRRGRPVRAENSVGLGFHELRWKLFFLRTLALYAARIAAVAS